MTRRASARVEGTRPGRRLSPLRLPAGARGGAGGLRAQRRARRAARRRGRRRRGGAFVARLAAEAPPLACDRVGGVDAAAARRAIASSGSSTAPRAASRPRRSTADAATCDDCLAELLDPADRRFRYPFVNCTNCGPRFTIVRGVPYDRPLTTMAGFAMCARCQAEYDDPADRRFHAQPNACPDCGPRCALGDARRATTRWPRPRRCCSTARSSRSRAWAATTSPAAPTTRRPSRGCARASTARTGRSRSWRPTSTTAADARRAGRGRGRAAVPGASARSSSRARRADAPVAAAVAPRSAELGVMLPYSPLHHLLAADAATTLVMTSGNVSDEPIAYRDDDAIERLAGIADHVLVHDRPIRTRTDDSVVRAVGGRPLHAAPLARVRARGAGAARRRGASCWPAEPSSRARSAWPRATRAWPGHHIGDLRNEETLRSFAVGVAHFERLFAVAPEVVAHDLHPDYLSTTYALARDDVAHVGVQHHHAHLAAVLAEHGERGPAIGAIYDGTGYGLDGTRVGRRAAGRRPGRIRARRPSVARAPARRRPRRAPAVADGLRMAGRGHGRRPFAAAGDRAARVACGGRAGTHGARRAADDEHGPALRRRRRPLRPAHRGQLRGPGGGRARGDQRSRRARRLSARRRRRHPRSPAGRSPPSRCRWRPASTRR